MIHPDADPSTELRLARTFLASREAVFRAWTEPRSLERWFWPWDARASLDLRAGGRYSLAARHPAAGPLRVGGRYVEVVPPERLVLTWRWDGDPESAETTVILELHDRGPDTELVLTHRGFASATQRDEHVQGWTDCLDRLPAVVAGA